MTKELKQKIINIVVQVVREEIRIDSGVEEICKCFDDQLIETLSKEIQAFDLLNDFGLEIRPKE